MAASAKLTPDAVTSRDAAFEYVRQTYKSRFPKDDIEVRDDAMSRSGERLSSYAAVYKNGKFLMNENLRSYLVPINVRGNLTYHEQLFPYAIGESLERWNLAHPDEKKTREELETLVGPCPPDDSTPERKAALAAKEAYYKQVLRDAGYEM